ncbi:MAG: endonuclease, partial [Agromyces sp.]|nr:endonuclease [Agromyces sp.]
GLARRTGHSTPAGLIATMKGGRYSEAVKLIAVGEATEPRAAFTGEPLPPRFPHVAAGVAAGRLGVEAAAVITSFLARVSIRASAEDVAWSESLLVERAPVVGVDGLARLIKQLEARLDPDGVRPREDELHGQRSLRIWEDSAGMVNLRGRFDPITGAPIKVAVESLVGAELHRARDARPAFGASGGGAAGAAADDAGAGHQFDPTTDTDAAMSEQRTIEQMNADALSDIARLAISSADASLPALAFATVVARIDHDALLSGLGHATIDGIDQPVSATEARQLAASAGIIPMICGGDGEVLDLGRGKRLFSKAQRLALAERDGGCAHPGCRRPIAHTQAHHIRWWKRHHGPTDLDNGVLLCAFHHGLLHRNGWGIEIRDNRAWFIPPPHLDPEQRPRAGNRSPHLELRRDRSGVTAATSRFPAASAA